MATIILEVTSIPGESTKTGYRGKMDALAIRDSIEVTSSYSSSGGVTSSRTVSATKHSDIELIRKRDKGSPLLARACASGKDLGLVKIYFLKTVGTALRPFMEFHLTATYVSRYESETDDENGRAYLPHLGSQGSKRPALPPALVGGFSLINKESGRPSPRALVSEIPAEIRSSEVERVWLCPTSITWKYTPYAGTVAGGVVEKTWSIVGASEDTATATETG